MIDGLDIICQEKYRKFLRKGVLRTLRRQGKDDREARSGLAYGLGDMGRSVAAAPGISLRETRINPVVELLVLIEPRGVEGCRRTAIVRANMREIAISMVET